MSGSFAKPMNDGVRFLLELGTLVALGYWGSQAVSGPGRWALALALPIAAASLWARWIAAKSVTAAPDPWRLVLEVTVFGGGAAALATAGQTTLATVLTAVVAVHLTLTFTLDQRRTAQTGHGVEARVPTLSEES